MATKAASAAFNEASKTLATELYGEPLPAPYPGEVRLVPSRKFQPGHLYPMVWAPVSGWVHADNSCPARKECRHREDAANMTSLTVRSQDGSALVERPVLLVEYDAAAISQGADVAVVAKWAYDLPGGGGQGVGVRGAEEGVRLLASRGEIIRVDECHLEYQDDREAFFMALATRYVINPDTGTEIKLDSQQRGKRVSKWENHAESYMRSHPGAAREYFNDKWYELGVVKASRNAALALMPSNVKSALLKAGLDAAAEVERAKRGGGRQEPPPAPRQVPARPAAPVEGEVVSNGATQQAGGAQPAATVPASGSPAATPPAAGPTEADYDRTVEQVRKVYDDLVQSSSDPAWVESIHNAVTKVAPLCVSRGTFYAERIKRTDVAAVLELLRAKQRGEPPPAAATGCEHEPTVTADDRYVCSKCGEVLDGETGQPLGPEKVTIAPE